MLIITLLVLGSAAVYFMSPEERRRAVDNAVALLRRAAGEAARAHARNKQAAQEDGPPPPRPVVTIILAGTLLAGYVWMAVAPGDLGDPDTLVSWGANFGPRTVNGEWWRLATASFVHAFPLDLLINLAALVPLSMVLERVVGRPALVAVYLSAGVLAGIASVSARPIAANTGAADAIVGLYGLLITSWMWGVIHRSPGVRLPVVTRLAPFAAVFVLYHLMNGGLQGTAVAASLVAGFAGGLVLARGVHVEKPPAVRIAVTVAATALVALVTAVPLRGLTDIRPRIAALVSAEQATAAAYDAEVEHFRKGRTSAAALCAFIEGEILPRLEAAGAPLNQMQGVPAQHQSLSAAAKGFFELRAESWRLRIRGLRKGSTAMLREADAVESKSLDLLRTLVAAESSV